MNHSCRYYLLLLSLFLLTAGGCTTPRRNTAGTRWLSGVNTRYNIYFNGYESYKEALEAMEKESDVNYIDLLPLHPATSLAQSGRMNDSFDRTIEKCTKAIQLRSLKIKPLRDRSRMRDPEYRSFVNQEEFNPFIHHAWLLMGKAQYYKGDCMNSLATFLYITRHFRWMPEVVAEAQIGMMQNYVALGWHYEAEDVANKIRVGPTLPKHLLAPLAFAQAQLQIAQNRYKEAIVSLQIASEGKMSKAQRARMNYVLGQLYAREGDSGNAYASFGRVIKSNPPYEMELNARIRQTEVYSSGNQTAAFTRLRRMQRDPKNRNYTDQLYYPMGRIKLAQKDTVEAIRLYRTAIDSSKTGGINKVMAEVALGDLYYDRQQYVEAQPCYSEAANVLSSTHHDYERVASRADILDELVVFIENVRVQDSLQRLVRMPEAERMSVIAQTIEELKRQEQEAERRVQRDKLVAQQENALLEARGAMGTSLTSQPTGATAGDRSWYFYNEALKSSGRMEFQRRWGSRKLEDDWRRRNKQVFFAEETHADHTNEEGKERALAERSRIEVGVTSTPKEEDRSTDLFDPLYYLQQLPFSEEEMEMSNAIIEEGLYNMAQIYAERLMNDSLAMECYTSLISRFPHTKLLSDVLYQQFILASKMEDNEQMSRKRAEMIEKFPQSKYTVAIADPNHFRNMSRSNELADSLYQHSYQLYLEGEMGQVQQNFELFNDLYPSSKIMPTFIFLHALSHVPSGNTDQFRESLTRLVREYPSSEAAPLSADMLKQLEQGMRLSGGGTMGYGMTWKMETLGASESHSVSVVEKPLFVHTPDSAHLIAFVFPSDSVNRNKLLYDVAAYNFNTFALIELDMEVATFGSTSMVLVKGFENYGEVVEYRRLIALPQALGSKIPAIVQPILISTRNYEILTRGGSLARYLDFYETEVLRPIADTEENSNGGE